MPALPTSLTRRGCFNCTYPLLSNSTVFYIPPQLGNVRIVRAFQFLMLPLARLVSASLLLCRTERAPQVVGPLLSRGCLVIHLFTAVIEHRLACDTASCWDESPVPCTFSETSMLHIHLSHQVVPSGSPSSRTSPLTTGMPRPVSLSLRCNAAMHCTAAGLPAAQALHHPPQAANARSDGAMRACCCTCVRLWSSWR